MQPLLDLVNRVNNLMSRNPRVQLPHKLYQINLSEGFNLVLDGKKRRIIERETIEDDDVSCVIDTSLDGLQALIHKPSGVMAQLMVGELKVSDPAAGLELGMALTKLMQAR